jgi:hypothetical protein
MTSLTFLYRLGIFVDFFGGPSRFCHIKHFCSVFPFMDDYITILKNQRQGTLFCHKESASVILAKKKSVYRRMNYQSITKVPNARFDKERVLNLVGVGHRCAWHERVLPLNKLTHLITSS